MPPPSPNSRRLAALAQTSFDFFHRVIRAFAEPNLPSSALSPQNHSSFASEYQRFKIWAVDLGLLVPGHGSLDYRLRDAESLGDTFESYLTDLNQYLEETLIFSNPDSGQAGYLALAYGQTEEDGTPELHNGDSTSSDDDGDEDEPQWYLDVLLASIIDVIDRLFKLATLIRNPSTRHLSSRAKLYRKPDPESGVDLIAAFGHYDHDYVVSVFRHYQSLVPEDTRQQYVGLFQTAPPVNEQWHITADCGFCSARTDPMTECDSSGQEQQTQSWVEAEHGALTLIHRFAKANNRRRQQFGYWKEHRAKLEKHTELALAQTRSVHIDVAAISRETREPKAVDGDQTRLFLSDMLAPPSVTTATALQSYLVAPVDAKSTISVSEYAASDWDPGREVEQFPPPPRRSPNNKFFECPYCYTTCPTEMLSDRAWKAHLIHDLRPYVCTYLDCRLGDELFDSRSDWIAHENNFHRKKWRCPEHSDYLYDSAQEYVRHVQVEHGMDSTVMCSTTFLRSCETVSSAVDRPCPICLCSLTDIHKFQSHLARHLERLSLFALPRSTGDEDKDDNEPDSAAAAGSTHGTDSEILVEPDSDWGNALLEAVRLGDLPIVKEKLIDNHLFNEASRETLGDPQNRSVVTTPGDLLDLERLLEATRGQLSLAPGPYTFLADELRTLEIVVAEIKEQITNRELENDIKDDLQTSVLSCERVLGGIWDKGSADEANRLRSRLISSIQRFDAVRHRLDSTYQADRYQGDQIEGYCTTALIEGASRGHKEIVDVLLDAGAHINGTAHGSAALQAASSAGNASMVRSLCRRGADVNQPADDETPLMAASLVKASDVVAELVKFGADVNAVLGDETALIGASFVGAVDVVSLLIEAGADPNITTDSTEHGTALIAASSRGAIDVVQVLLDAGADVNAEAGGNTALSTACKYGGLGLATVELLLQHGADVNSQPASGHTALWKAAAEGHGDTVKLLLNAGADISKGGSFGSPLNAAIWNVHETVVDMLIEAGADVNSVSGVYTALESASKFGRDEIVRKLLAAGANPKSFTHAGHFHSPLHSAAGCGMDAVVKLLLKAGAPIDETDSSGKAALHIACRSGIERIVEILIEAGANLDVPSDDGTPLEIAKEKRYTDIVDKLARARANRLRASLLAQSIPKFAQVERGSVVTQSWTLQNPGPRSWPAGCVLYHSDGAEMPRLDDGTHGRPSPLKPGESAVLTIQVQAPDNPGRCVAFWGLKDPDATTAFYYALGSDVASIHHKTVGFLLETSNYTRGKPCANRSRQPVLNGLGVGADNAWQRHQQELPPVYLRLQHTSRNLKREIQPGSTYPW